MEKENHYLLLCIVLQKKCLGNVKEQLTKLSAPCWIEVWMHIKKPLPFIKIVKKSVDWSSFVLHMKVCFHEGLPYWLTNSIPFKTKDWYFATLHVYKHWVSKPLWCYWKIPNHVLKITCNPYKTPTYTLHTPSTNQSKLKFICPNSFS